MAQYKLKNGQSRSDINARKQLSGKASILFQILQNLVIRNDANEPTRLMRSSCIFY